MTPTPPARPAPARPDSPGAVFAAFLRLGLTSFGGPVAHLGYFRREFVVRRRWLDDGAYAELAALAQVIPGPASSQVGFALGLQRAGVAGGLAAWAGFTLPSALFMALFAWGARDLSAQAWGAGLAHGLKLAALAVVAHAALGMARNLCRGPVRIALAVAATVLALAVAGAPGQLAGIGLGWAVGALALPRMAGAAQGPASPLSARAGLTCLVIFAALLAACPLLARTSGGGALFAAFYGSGALVFGGGHVVAPLLDAAVVQPGWVGRDAFLQGYGAVQAAPGPLFTFAAYLGQAAAGPGGAALATAAIFLPGLLLMAGLTPLWARLSRRPRLRGAIDGTNAAVVGLLAAALYDPIFVEAVTGPYDLVTALVALVVLWSGRVPPILVVAGCAGAGVVMALAG